MEHEEVIMKEGGTQVSLEFGKVYVVVHEAEVVKNCNLGVDRQAEVVLISCSTRI